MNSITDVNFWVSTEATRAGNTYCALLDKPPGGCEGYTEILSRQSKTKPKRKIKLKTKHNEKRRKPSFSTEQSSGRFGGYSDPPDPSE